MIMYAGRIVEQGSRDQVLREPIHPYSRALFKCGMPLQMPNDGKSASAVCPPSQDGLLTQAVLHLAAILKTVARSDEHLLHPGPRADARLQGTYGALFQIWG